ncbi:MAG: hypothetical protein ACOYN6_01910 [Ignavibacteria bacterium]
MELIKIDDYNFNIDEKYFIPNYYELRCKLASRTNPLLFNVDESFLTSSLTRAEYEMVESEIQITLPIHDSITEISIDIETGDTKVQFDYLPREPERSEIKTEVMEFLKQILKQDESRICDTIECRHKHKYTISGACKKYYWME